MSKRDLSAVGRFADRMREKLRENEHKPHWADCSPTWLLDRLFDEANELRDELRDSQDAGAVARECADVANFAMMIADVVGGLPGVTQDVVECADCVRWTARIKLLEARLDSIVSTATR